jgi:hypothetical protein
MSNVDLINHIAATIRRMDGGHTMNAWGVAALAEAIVADLPSAQDAITELRAEFAEAHADGASSNDIAQLLDDWLVKHGRPTVLYG